MEPFDPPYVVAAVLVAVISRALSTVAVLVSEYVPDVTVTVYEPALRELLSCVEADPSLHAYA
jgi:hypothetical protein